MCAPSWLKEQHGLELRVAQEVMPVAHNPPEYREREDGELVRIRLARAFFIQL
jgi:hypothetical protein